MKGSFECTDWNVFVESAANAGNLVDTVCDNINFCVECSIPRKTVQIYPNNNLTISKHVKGMLNQKKQAFAKHHREKLKQVQKKLKHEIKKGKKKYN